MKRNPATTHLLLMSSLDIDLEACITASFERGMRHAIVYLPKGVQGSTQNFLKKVPLILGLGSDLHFEWVPQLPLMKLVQKLTDKIQHQKKLENTVQINLCNQDNDFLIPGYIAACLNEVDMFISGSTKLSSEEGREASVLTLPRVPFCRPMTKRLWILQLIEDGVKSQDNLRKQLNKIDKKGPFTQSGISHHVKYLEGKGLVTSRKIEREKKMELTAMGRIVLAINKDRLSRA